MTAKGCPGDGAAESVYKKLAVKMSLHAPRRVGHRQDGSSAMVPPDQRKWTTGARAMNREVPS